MEPFEVKAGASTAQFSLTDNGYPVTKKVCLVHVMSRKENCPPLFKLEQQLPDLAMYKIYNIVYEIYAANIKYEYIMYIMYTIFTMYILYNIYNVYIV